MKPKNAEALRPIVAEILKDLGIKKPPVDPRKIAISLGAKVLLRPYTGEESDISGMIFHTKDKAVIAVNSSHPKTRQRFTIAHEIGHMQLHSGKKDLYVDTDFRVNLRDSISSQATDPEEIEANRFAAELLMPHKMMMNDLKGHVIDMEDEELISSLSKKYKVSKQAMTFRIHNLLSS